MKKWLVLVMGIGLLFSTGATVPPAGGQAVMPSFEALGDLPGGDFYSSGWGLSSDGSTVTGESASSDFLSLHAFCWTAERAMEGLPLVAGREDESHGRALSGDGHKIAGWCGWEILGWEACVWTYSETEGWTVVGLGDLAGGTFASHAYYMTPSGNVVVGDGRTAKCPLACRWTWDGAGWTLQAIDSNSGRNYWSLAAACSDDGSVIVGERCRTSGPIAFRWTKASGIVDLGTLPKMKCSSAAACSANGSVVAGQSYPTIGARSSGLAFRWTAATGMVGLGDLPGGSIFSTVRGISPDGSIIVGSSGTASGNEAFIWDATNGMRRLADYLAYHQVFVPIGWTLSSANSIAVNAGVITIVGAGVNLEGKTEAWRAVLYQ